MYLFQWIFCEKIRGLDFTMRDKSLLKKSGGVLHGYSKTNDKHLREIFDLLSIKPEDSIIDIGCGKGNVLRQAYKYPFGKICGIELDERLVSIAKKNFKVLKMEDRIEVLQADALQYDNYANFNHFYFFNPFDEIVMDKVINNIIQQKNGIVKVIYYNPTCYETIEKYGGKKIHELYDDSKSYATYIYEL